MPELRLKHAQPLLVIGVAGAVDGPSSCFVPVEKIPILHDFDVVVRSAAAVSGNGCSVDLGECRERSFKPWLGSCSRDGRRGWILGRGLLSELFRCLRRAASRLDTELSL
jgi:hypothetical protein